MFPVKTPGELTLELPAAVQTRNPRAPQQFRAKLLRRRVPLNPQHIEIACPQLRTRLRKPNRLTPQLPRFRIARSKIGGHNPGGAHRRHHPVLQTVHPHLRAVPIARMNRIPVRKPWTRRVLRPVRPAVIQLTIKLLNNRFQIIKHVPGIDPLVHRPRRKRRLLHIHGKPRHIRKLYLIPHPVDIRLSR